MAKGLNFSIQPLTLALITLSICAKFTGASLAQVLPNFTADKPSSEGKVAFYCDRHEGKPAMIAKHPQRGEVTLIVFVSKYFSASGWNPQRRCEQISYKFQLNSEKGHLRKVIASWYNNLMVFCASEDQSVEYVSGCEDDRVLMTLRRQDRPEVLLEELRGLKQGKKVSPLYHSQQDIVEVDEINNIYVVDMEEWVDHAAPTVQEECWWLCE